MFTRRDRLLNFPSMKADTLLDVSRGRDNGKKMITQSPPLPPPEYVADTLFIAVLYSVWLFLRQERVAFIALVHQSVI